MCCYGGGDDTKNLNEILPTNFFNLKFQKIDGKFTT